jgi:hypothetical protein
MARDNRAANRQAAKKERGADEPEAANGIEAGGSRDFSDLMENDFDNVDDEDRPVVGETNKGAAGEDLNLETEDEGEDGDAKESESLKEGAAPSDVNNEGDEEARKAEEAKAAEEAEAKKVEALAAKDAEPAQTPEEAAAAAAAAKAVPAAKAEPAPKVEEKKEETKQLTAEEASNLFKEWRNTTEDLLAKHHYNLSEKDVEEFNENPGAFVSKAMSRVYLDSIQAAFQQFTNYLPRMVGQVLEMKKHTSEREESFYSAWPKLREHQDTVLRMGASYRAQNPTATLDQFIKEVGAQAMVALRLPMDASGAASAASAPAPKKPFKPAGTSGATPTPQKSNGEDNVFGRLAEEFSFEDLPGS